MAEQWTRFQMNQIPQQAFQNVKVDFEITPDLQDPRSANDIIQQIEAALRNPSSLLRSGASGFLLDGASLARSPITTPLVQFAGQDGTMYRNPEFSRVEQQQSTFPDEPPTRADNTDELLSRISELLKTIDDMSQEKQKADEEKSELVKKLAESDSMIIDKMKEVNSLADSLSQAQKDIAYMTTQLDDSRKQVNQAKEMWMKESSRATKLRDSLDKAEQDIADNNKAILAMSSDFKIIETENVNLKHLINRSNDIVSSRVLVPQDSKFSISDSYFVRGSTMANMAAGNGGARNMLFTNPHMQPISGHAGGRYLQLSGYANDGILFEDEIMQIGVKAKYTGMGEGVLGIYFGNKTSGSLQSITTKYESPSNFLHLTTSPVPVILGPKSQVCQRVSVQLSGAFIESPKLTVSFLLPDNTPRIIPLRLPVTIGKFMQERIVSIDEFFSNWRMQIAMLNESSAVVNVSMNLAQIARASCLGGALALHHQIDDVADNLVLVGQFPSDSEDGIRCATIPEAIAMVRIEVGAGDNMGKARVAVRSNDATVAESVRQCIVDQISTA